MTVESILQFLGLLVKIIGFTGSVITIYLFLKAVNQNKK